MGLPIFTLFQSEAELYILCRRGVYEICVCCTFTDQHTSYNFLIDTLVGLLPQNRCGMFNF